MRMKSHRRRGKACMRATIVGNTRDLKISCENGDRRFLGDVRVEGRGTILEAFEDQGSAGTFQQHVDGFVSIYGQQSDALRRAIIVRDLDKPYQQAIDRYADLRSLAVFDREGARLFISVMMSKVDFEYFADMIETNFFADLQYVLDVPFHSLPQSGEAQAETATKYGYVLPTKPEFRSGKPCFFPNADISFGFEHPAPGRSG